MAVGVLCTSMPDNAGPIHHRRTAMMYTIGFIFIVSLICGLLAKGYIIVLIMLAVFSFAFSVIGVYGTRAGAVGLACMVAMCINVDQRLELKQTVINSLFIAAGGVWYFFVSTIIHRIRPYKLVQQALGDCMLETAEYIKIKASFFLNDSDLNEKYKKLADAHVLVNQKQTLVREMLFKTRSIVKDSTHTGRVLLMSFLDTIDLFERIMTSQRQYAALHFHLGDTHLMTAIGNAVLKLGNELQLIGLSFQSGIKAPKSQFNDRFVLELETYLKDTKAKHLNDTNANAYESLEHILDNISDLQKRIEALQRYSTYDPELIPDNAINTKQFDEYVDKSDFSIKILFDNLNFDSGIFRHSIRVSLAILSGYILSLIMPIGHDYWILLTIVVILKPAFALTQQRNKERLIGTIVGAFLAGVLLYVTNKYYVLLSILIVCMILAYSLMRIKYGLSIVFMTIFIVLGFYFLKVGEQNPNDLLKERVIDTIIGSVISITFLYLIPPKWEKYNMHDLAVKTIQSNKSYFTYIAHAFMGERFDTHTFKLKRKESYVALANFGDSFQRMLSEPKKMQQNGDYIHQMVVSNYMLASHIATLAGLKTDYKNAYNSQSFDTIIKNTNQNLQYCINLLNNAVPANFELRKLNINTELNLLIEDITQKLSTATADKPIHYSSYMEIVEQLEIINRISIDVVNVSKHFHRV